MPKRLLIVDDERGILRALRRLFRTEPYELLLASSGEEALELLQHQAVEVILTDFRMPGITGSELLEKAKQSHPNITGIVLSGYAELDIIQRALEQGFIYKHLPKPWKDSELLEGVADAFRFADSDSDSGSSHSITNPLTSKPSALFVDPEPAILRALKRSLRQMADEWTFHFFDSFESAQSLLNEGVPWALVMDSRTLTDEAFRHQLNQHAAPALRIMMTSSSDEETLIQGAHCAHLFLPKPFEPEALIATLEKARVLHEFTMSDQLRSCLGTLEGLPILPQFYRHLQSEFDQDEPKVERIAQLIHDQPPVIAKLLHIANSAFFGYPRPATTAEEVVMRLGLEMVQALVLFSGIFEIDEDAEDAKQIQAIADEALVFCEVVGRLADLLSVNRRERTALLLAGLVHNLGKMVKLRCAASCSGSTLELNEEEYEVSGAFVLTLWGFEQSLIDATLLQNQLVLAQGVTKRVQVIHLARRCTLGELAQVGDLFYSDAEVRRVATELAEGGCDGQINL